MSRRPQRGFTLVEMLVVIGIIGVLAALLLPAVMSAITRARNTVIALEVNGLDTAIEAYRLEKGDYPPNFRDAEVVRRHIAKCYPGINNAYFTSFMVYAFPPAGISTPANTTTPVIDEAESLVFWLSMTDVNKQFPFRSLDFPVTGIPAASLPAAQPKKYFDFDQTRLTTLTSPVDVPAFMAKFCKETNYLYLDSRSYSKPPPPASAPAPYLCKFTSPDGVNLYAIDGESSDGVRPYFSSPNTTPATIPATALYRDQPNIFKPEKPSSFQLICAGQDGDFGSLAATDVKISTGALAGTNYDPLGADKDNITNFSNGKLLGDIIP